MCVCVCVCVCVSECVQKFCKSFLCTVPKSEAKPDSATIAWNWCYSFLERTRKNCFTKKIAMDNKMSQASSNSYWRRNICSPAASPSSASSVLPDRTLRCQSHYLIYTPRISRMNELLSDHSTYKKLPKNPLRQLTSRINGLTNKGHVTTIRNQFDSPWNMLLNTQIWKTRIFLYVRNLSFKGWNTLLKNNLVRGKAVGGAFDKRQARSPDRACLLSNAPPTVSPRA